MPKFSYEVVNPEQKRLSGVIDAPDEASAKEELNALGFSIIELSEKIPEQASKEPSFHFEAKDKTGRSVSGTIAAESAYGAFKRLIQEYYFEVETLGSENIPKLYETLHQESGARSASSELLAKAEAEDQARQISFVLEKCDSFLREFGAALAPEDKRTIEKSRDRLLRLKSSTNMELIKKSAEDLLALMQNKEIIATEKGIRTRARAYALEAHRLMSELEKKHTQPRMTLQERMRAHEASHRSSGKPFSFFEKIWFAMLEKINEFFEEPEEIIRLTSTLKAIRAHLWEYLVLIIKEKNPEYRAGFKESFKKLWGEYRSLRQALKTVRSRAKETLSVKGEPAVFAWVVSELSVFTGLLVLIYGSYFLVSFLMQTKLLPFSAPPFFLVGMEKSFLLSFTTLFLIHGALSIKQYFFLRNTSADFIIFPVALLMIGFMLLNL